jgi:hypothetical protein
MAVKARVCPRCIRAVCGVPITKQPEKSAVAPHYRNQAVCFKTCSSQYQRIMERPCEVSLVQCVLDSINKAEIKERMLELVDGPCEDDFLVKRSPKKGTENMAVPF